MWLGPYFVARVGDLCPLGNCAARRRLPNDDVNDDDLDHNNNLGNCGEPLFGLVSMDVASWQLLVVDVLELRGGDLDDDNLDDEHDGRPVRATGDLDDDLDLDDLDLDDNARSLSMFLPVAVRRRGERLHGDGLCSWQPGPPDR